MKGSSKVVMGTTMAIVIILAIVLGLVFVLLAELYCSLLFRRKKLHTKAGKAVSATGNPSPLDPNVIPSPLSSFYAQGVLEAPRSFLFPKLPSKREKHHQITEHDDDIENQTHGKLHEFLRVQSPRQIGIASLSLPLPLQSKPHKPEIHEEIHEENEERYSDDCEGGMKSENFMYISNPMYDNDMVTAGNNGDTPFETPDGSPSRLDEGSGSESESEEEVGSLPLTPMKNLPAKGGSVAVRDARSLGSESNNSHIGRCSSSSASPCTSPSW